MALMAHVASSGLAQAEDADHPQVWIELGGQLARLQDGHETFAPSVMDGRPSGFDPSQMFEKPPRYGFDGVGALTVQPEGSKWVFTASAQYGRSKSNKYHLQQTNPEPFPKYFTGVRVPARDAIPIAQRFAETTARDVEQHVILDFKVGRDVGLGLFKGVEGTSTISAGVRFAQFGSKTNISLKSDPDWHFVTKYNPIVHGIVTNGQPFHSNLASMYAERSFHGVGPALSWQASAPLIGNERDGAILADVGFNAAVLFGRQKAQTHHQTTVRSFPAGRIAGAAVPHTVSRFPNTPDHARARSITVPNIGGFAGLSMKYPNAKVSFGYRADFFFGAMDGGIDTRKTYDVGFHGPYASVSIGLGG